MKHPTSIQWQELLDITKPVFLSPLLKENNFNMMVAKSCATNLCETVFCVGGYASIAFGIKDHNDEYDYVDGATAIAQTLGFTNKFQLVDWAMANPEIWGNHHGGGMFCEKVAYKNSRRMLAKKLSDVWHHWEGVRDRTLELEEKGLI